MDAYRYLSAQDFVIQFFANPDKTVLDQSMYIDLCTLLENS